MQLCLGVPCLMRHVNQLSDECWFIPGRCAMDGKAFTCAPRSCVVPGVLGFFWEIMQCIVKGVLYDCEV